MSSRQSSSPPSEPTESRSWLAMRRASSGMASLASRPDSSISACTGWRRSWLAAAMKRSLASSATLSSRSIDLMAEMSVTLVTTASTEPSACGTGWLDTRSQRVGASAPSPWAMPTICSMTGLPLSAAWAAGGSPSRRAPSAPMKRRPAVVARSPSVRVLNGLARGSSSTAAGPAISRSAMLLATCTVPSTERMTSPSCRDCTSVRCLRSLTVSASSAARRAVTSRTATTAPVIRRCSTMGEMVSSARKSPPPPPALRRSRSPAMVRTCPSASASATARWPSEAPSSRSAKPRPTRSAEVKPVMARAAAFTKVTVPSSSRPKMPSATDCRMWW